MPRLAITLALLLVCAPARVRAQALDQTQFQAPPLFMTSVAVKPDRPSALMAPLYGSFAGLTAADGYLTWLAVHRGAIEANQFVAPIAGDAAGLTGLKVATGAVTVLAVERLRRQHPRTAMWIMVAANGSMMWVVWHNAQVAGLGR